MMSRLLALAMAAVVSVSCTTLDEPRGRVGVVDAGTDALADGGAPDALVVNPCHRSHTWRIDGFPSSFFPGKAPSVGVWGLGDFFTAPDSDETVRLDAYVAGSASELLARRVVLGQRQNASFATFTHLFELRLGCAADGTACAPGLYVPVSGEAIATRLEPRNGSSLEIQAENVVLRRAVRKGNELVFTDGPDACEFFERLIVAGATVAPTMSCAVKSYLECEFVGNAEQRHP